MHQEGNRFEETVQDQPAVNDIEVISTHDGGVLYALDWDNSDDTIFEGLVETETNLLEAHGVADTWSFDLRSQSHEEISSFQKYCTEHDIPIEVQGLYNPT